MTLLQIVITKNVLGQYKVSLMGLNRTTGMGETFKTYRGEFWCVLWRVLRNLSGLKAHKQ